MKVTIADLVSSITNSILPSALKSSVSRDVARMELCVLRKPLLALQVTVSFDKCLFSAQKEKMSGYWLATTADVRS